jgi:hypothetical protein
MLLSHPGLITTSAAPVLELEPERDIATAIGHQHLPEEAQLLIVQNWTTHWLIPALLNLIQSHVLSHALWVMKNFICE